MAAARTVLRGTGRRLVAALVAAMCWPGAAAARTDAAPEHIVLLTDEGHPPYVYAGADGSARGRYPELLRSLFAGLPAFSVELRPMPWQRALVEVEAGRADGVVAPYRKPALRPWMRYSEPLLPEVTVVVCRPEVAARLRGALWPRDFAGLRVGNTAGYLLAGEQFFFMVDRGEIALEEAARSENNLLKLQAGRIDCYPDDREAIAAESNRLGIPAGSFVETAVIGTEYGHVGYPASGAGATPARERFIRALDAAIRARRAAGGLPAAPE